ncbi:MAG: hypothetical protein A3F12_05635 [Gammaproteobacteria bacterium RIFCSPHIGHO2_12_FULL_38_14]|nr:MAG: hypothetical protein A3F12_05635 [Gammaproteobacteria bacterium RIFCSPHIGHO2_12_FULL_38_14]
MFKSFSAKLKQKIYHWITYEPATKEILPYDYDRLKYEIKPGDVLLVEGRSRISRIIRSITQSPWTHAALYIGRLIDIEDEEIQQIIRKHINVKDNTRLVIEGVLNQGTIITPLKAYRHHHIRICRPIGITPTDARFVIYYAIKALGQMYNVRQLFDLARLLLPWPLIPKRWKSSLFRTPSGEPESGVCSSLIAEAFATVQFPILPFVKIDEKKGYELFRRNPYLYTPKDFDYSPYFEIIKYPLFNPDEPLPYYRRLPWSKSRFMHQDHGVLTESPHHKKKSDSSDENPSNNES